MRYAFIAAGALLAATASAQEEMETTAPSFDLPRTGSWQVFFTSPPVATQNYAAGFFMPRGLGLNFGSVGGSGFTQFGFGLNGGAAYSLTDLVAVGGAVAIDVGSTTLGFGTGATALQFLLEPGAKLNLSSKLDLGPRFNPFVWAGLPIGVTGTNFASGATFGLDLAAGVEVFVGRSWAVSLAVPLGLYFTASTPSIFLVNVGFQYGVAVFF
ncbi:MAG: hypothetical protein ACOZIN_13330 [Myxococcota bacterium]